ncbi:MAG: response regulator transcription factor [Syntrophales bacterium]|nr:response regulator transcription factor [Syntrophales bacterium]
MKPIRILIADDHAVLREGLRQLLSLQGDFEVVGEAVDGVETLEKVRSLKPDILLLDIAMPRMDGLEALTLVRESVPETRVVILSMFEKEAFTQEALRRGAFGYVLKGAPSSEMLDAIRCAHAGGYFLSHSIQAAVINGYLAGRQERTPSTYDHLTDREKEVFSLVIHGNATAQIGEILCISGKTVEKHRANIVHKLGTTSIVDMIKFAVRHGILDLETWRS